MLPTLAHNVSVSNRLETEFIEQILRPVYKYYGQSDHSLCIVAYAELTTQSFFLQTAKTEYAETMQMHKLI